MITPEQAAEIRRLASLWATARVRRVMTHAGHGGLLETPIGTTERAERAAADFENYLKTLMEP